MIVITGTQRSGTSFMAKFIYECGYDLGTDFWDNRIDGGFENPDICNFYRDLVGSNSFPFTKYWDLINVYQFKSFTNLNSRVAKFSYLCMVPAFVEQWFTSRGNKDKFIVMVRDVEKVIKSKKSREDIFKAEDWCGLEQTQSELLMNRQRSLITMKKYGMDYLLVPFPFTVADIPIIGEFTGLQLSKEVFKSLFDPNKIHF